MRMSPWPSVPMWRSNFRPGTEKIKAMLATLSHPEKKLPPVIHIAGTNGKGSSLAMLKSIYEFAGYKVCTYSSPHIVNFNERIYLAGSFISDEYINDLIDRCKAVADSMNYKPGFFEGVTLMAFLAFSETPADIIILETGMGGRLDCTNVIDNPAATLITTIDFDHTEHLGDTLEKIAMEKAGIMKTGSPCIIGMQRDDVYETLFAAAKEKNAKVIAYEYDYGIDLDLDNLESDKQESFQFLFKERSIEFPLPSLPGDHQLLNAGAVIATVLAVNDKVPVKIESIRQGIANTYWPGRLERIQNNVKEAFLPDYINLYLDGAHNNAGAMVLGHWIFQQNVPTILILGMTKNRNPGDFVSNIFVSSMLNNRHSGALSSENSLYPIIEGLTVAVESEPFSFESADLAAKINKSIKNKSINSDINMMHFRHMYTLEDSFAYISDNYNSDKYRDSGLNVIVSGSLFLVADCHKMLQ